MFLSSKLQFLLCVCPHEKEKAFFSENISFSFLVFVRFNLILQRKKLKIISGTLGKAKESVIIY